MLWRKVLTTSINGVGRRAKKIAKLAFSPRYLLITNIALSTGLSGAADVFVQAACRRRERQVRLVNALLSLNTVMVTTGRLLQLLLQLYFSADVVVLPLLRQVSVWGMSCEQLCKMPKIYALQAVNLPKFKLSLLSTDQTENPFSTYIADKCEFSRL